MRRDMSAISDRVAKLKKRADKIHQKKMNEEIAAAGTNNNDILIRLRSNSSIISLFILYLSYFYIIHTQSVDYTFFL